jgi:pyruvate, water dikinase
MWFITMGQGSETQVWILLAGPQPVRSRLELDAIRHVWDQGHTNFHVMLPFVRTARELVACRSMFGEVGLLDRRGFELWVMAEVPSVVFNLASYAERGIDAISVNIDLVDRARRLIGAAEQRMLLDHAR